MSLNYTVNKVNFIDPIQDKYPRMLVLAGESIFIGFCVLIIGKIALDLFNSKNPFKFNNNKNSNTKYNKEKNKENYKLCLAFFVSGFAIHMLNELLGVNCYFCSKECLKNVSNFTNKI